MIQPFALIRRNILARLRLRLRLRKKKVEFEADKENM
jgi:hypothetical protein